MLMINSWCSNTDSFLYIVLKKYMIVTWTHHPKVGGFIESIWVFPRTAYTESYHESYFEASGESYHESYFRNIPSMAATRFPDSGILRNSHIHLPMDLEYLEFGEISFPIAPSWGNTGGWIFSHHGPHAVGLRRQHRSWLYRIPESPWELVWKNPQKNWNCHYGKGLKQVQNPSLLGVASWFFVGCISFRFTSHQNQRPFMFFSSECHCNVTQS